MDTPSWQGRAAWREEAPERRPVLRGALSPSSPSQDATGPGPSSGHAASQGCERRLAAWQSQVGRQAPRVPRPSGPLSPPAPRVPPLASVCGLSAGILPFFCSFLCSLSQTSHFNFPMFPAPACCAIVFSPCLSQLPPTSSESPSFPPPLALGVSERLFPCPSTLKRGASREKRSAGSVDGLRGQTRLLSSVDPQGALRQS